MKVLCVPLALLLVGPVACGNGPGGATQRPNGTHAGNQSHVRGAAVVMLSKEEVGAILGTRVTSVEGTATDMDYKTEVLALETTIGIESENDSVEAMAGARKATALLGGTAEDVPKLGDDAFFGAMSLLYVRKGDIVVTITPPNLQQVAAMGAYGQMTKSKLGSDDQLKALEELGRIEKTDPMAAGLKSGDAMQGALATVAAASKKQGTPYETQARAMAVALAAKVLSKL